jgi:hypothetical protein
VECQLNALRKCFTPSAIRSTLEELPETLDETYNRILNNIPRYYRKEAFFVMQLVAVSYRPLTLSEVADAAVVNCENEKFDPGNRLRDSYDLLEICSSLIAITSR